jgi:hypothetical protein
LQEEVFGWEKGKKRERDNKRRYKEEMARKHT